MMIRTLIVEDEPLARQILREFASQLDWLVLIGEAADGHTAVELINSLKPDLILLDIQMPEMSGLEVLNRADYQPAVIFTTAFARYAVKAFEFEAIDYLLKPFGNARFHSAVERARRRLKEKFQEKNSKNKGLWKESVKEMLTRLFVRSGDTIIPLKIDEISRFEADDDYVRVYAGNRYFLINQTLSELESRLDASRFCRIHRSIIVNLEFVERVETQDRRLLLILKDKTEILASRSGSQTLRKLIF